MRTCIALALLASIGSVRPADACSPPPCWLGSLVPADGATIPANAPALYWRPSVGQAAPTVKLTVAGTGANVPFTEVADGESKVLALAQPLVPGTQYVLEETNECQYQQPIRSTFTAGATAPLPTTLGTTQREASRRGNVTIATRAGSCSLDVDAAHATITLAHAADATPWKDLLLYETRVDGQGWAPSTAINVTTPVGGSWRGRGRDQLYRLCADNHGEGQGLAEGTHQAAFRARLPGSTTSLKPHHARSGGRDRVRCSAHRVQRSWFRLEPEHAEGQRGLLFDVVVGREQHRVGRVARATPTTSLATLVRVAVGRVIERIQPVGPQDAGDLRVGEICIRSRPRQVLLESVGQLG